MMRRVPNFSSLVVTAIKDLRENHGATSKEIMNYISSRSKAGASSIQRQMRTALKRGLSYGILKRSNGRYCLNTDSELIKPAQIATRTKRSRKRTLGKNKRNKKGNRTSRKGLKKRTRTRSKSKTVKNKNSKNSSSTTKRVRREPASAENHPKDGLAEDVICCYRNENENCTKSRETTPLMKTSSTSQGGVEDEDRVDR